MKYFSRTLKWTTVVGFVFFGIVSTPWSSFSQVDPSDDFSFSLHSGFETESYYRLIPEARISEIFVDRLDLFPKSEVPKLSRHLLNLCRQYRFDPAFILSLISVESSFRTHAISSAGAVGLMQLMPQTASVILNDWGVSLGQTFQISERSLMDPFVNLHLGIAYLAWLRDRYAGRSPYYLVAAYNLGPSRMDELLSRKSFKPVKTKKYFEAIRRGVPGLRFYQRGQTGV